MQGSSLATAANGIGRKAEEDDGWRRQQRPFTGGGESEEEFVGLKPATHVWPPQGTVLIIGDSNSWMRGRER
jgi:hypothetical protein